VTVGGIFEKHSRQCKQRERSVKTTSFNQNSSWALILMSSHPHELSCFVPTHIVHSSRAVKGAGVNWRRSYLEISCATLKQPFRLQLSQPGTAVNCLADSRHPEQIISLKAFFIASLCSDGELK
jgi:hypothetical protein